MSDTDFVLITDDLIESCYQRVISSVDIEQVSREIDFSLSEMIFIYGIVKEESRQTLSLLRGIKIKHDARLLEVGAGYGIASICLAMMGLNVTALEPGGIGFEENSRASKVIARMCGVELNHLTTTVEEADFELVEKFDLVFSNNVLEHIDDVQIGLTNLIKAIKPEGIMIHSCANYAFPYEPHFSKPLFPVFPQLTKYVLPHEIRNHGVWKSLNFITAAQVKRNSKKNDVFCAFRKGTMTTSIRRLRSDETFAARHKWPRRIASNDFLFKFLVAIFSLPTSLATPMDFLICSKEQKSSAAVQDWLRATQN